MACDVRIEAMLEASCGLFYVIIVTFVCLPVLTKMKIRDVHDGSSVGIVSVSTYS